MKNTLLSQTVLEPSRLGMPASRSASATGIAAVDAVRGGCVRDRSTGFAPTDGETSAWSPPTT